LGSYSIVISSTATATIDGLTVRGHTTNEADSNSLLRGPIQNSGVLTIKNSKIVDNKGVKVSAISCLTGSSKLYLENTLIANNISMNKTANSTNYGGGRILTASIMLVR